MKKLIAIMLSVMLLLSTCAFAAGMELTISNVVVESNGTAIDLSGIDARLAAAQTEGAAGLRIALDGNGENVVSGIASLTAEKLLLSLTGLSDLYSISMEDLEDMADVEINDQEASMQDVQELVSFSEEDIAALEQWGMKAAGALMGCVNDMGERVVDDVTYHIYSIYLGEETVDALARELIVILDGQPQLVQSILEESEFASLMEAYETVGLKMNVDGAVSVAGELSEGYVTLNMSSADGAQLALTCEFFLTNMEDTEAGIGTVDLVAILSADAEGNASELFTLGLTVNTLTESGEFYSADGYILTPDEESEGGEITYGGLMFALYSPAQTEDVWYAELQDMSSGAIIGVRAGELDGLNCFGLGVSADGMDVNISYEGTNGAGVIGLDVAEGGVSVLGVTADVLVSEVDGDWLITEAGESVDILTITEEQQQVLSAEAMGVLFTALSELAAANETVAALVGGMMG